MLVNALVYAFFGGYGAATEFIFVLTFALIEAKMHKGALI